MLLLVHSATRTVNKFRITIDSGHIWLTLSSWRYLRQNLNCLWQNEIKCFNYFTVAYQSISRRNWINKTVGNKVFYEVYEKVNICKSNNIYIIEKQSDGDKNIPCWTPNLRNKKILFRQWVNEREWNCNRAFEKFIFNQLSLLNNISRIRQNPTTGTSFKYGFQNGAVVFLKLGPKPYNAHICMEI